MICVLTLTVLSAFAVCINLGHLKYFQCNVIGTTMLFPGCAVGLLFCCYLFCSVTSVGTCDFVM